MRSSITRGVEAIRKQYNIPERMLVAKEKERVIEINLPNVKDKIYILPYTPTVKVKSLIRKVMKGEESFQDALMRNTRQRRML